MNTPDFQTPQPASTDRPIKRGFIGLFAQVADSKNRISIPQRFRDILLLEYREDNLSVVITLTMDKNIAIYPTCHYYKYLDTVDEDIPQDQRHKRRHRRMAFEALSDTDTLDNQNRIRINPKLLECAGIKRDIYIVGFTDRIEVWDRAKYDRFIQSQIQSLPDTLGEA
jgi:MraZ protein